MVTSKGILSSSPTQATGLSNGVKYSRPDYDISLMDPHWADVQMVQLIGEGKKVLEIGCASGHFGKYLKGKAGCKVWAVEIDEKLAKLAEPYYEKILVGDVQNEKVIEQFVEKFDVILCSNVLEHLSHPLKVLINLKNLLEKDGYFVIALPNVAHWSVRLKLLFGKFDYTEAGVLDNAHLKFFTLKTAFELLEKSGLRVERWSFDWDNGIPKFNGLISRIPKIGPVFLKWFYSLRPALFGYQFILKAKPI